MGLGPMAFSVSGMVTRSEVGIPSRIDSVIGMSRCGSPRNAAISASDMTRYLPEFSEDTEYITTKKASSKVIRSP